MKRFIASIIVLGMIAIGITVEASEYDCELTIDANVHDEENPAFPTSGCDDMPALGWYSEGEFTLSGFSGMMTVSDEEIIDLGMGTNVKVTTIDKKSKPKEKSKSESSKSEEKDAPKKSSSIKETSEKAEKDDVKAKEAKEKNGDQATEKSKDEEAALKSEKDSDEEALEVVKGKDDDVASNSSLKNVFIIASIIIIGGFILFIFIRRRKAS